ncbi:decaprenylphospho-beta-D-erythro-pentofuranosid-2-ulose 2-reductase [Propionibacterium cyclohexanicum]|uniref:Decaprenylphospho-beta-D-erythro-pentofuranosid-2-ulose 2-reductase n=1 Tax=Propionibacterium cyclohexanicum TaxID=64702 RepID=A0A1H9PH78_9ACTN|nr:decaprenylphospho-beta-D-erythro-pentofuranosid-2-ulose 2-reductase [Propionibacterium cyclohexanicum]SER47528.1 decaprenylphospho-beta-D-erythro-pentofuranosid-2-ulose 2-reductase [Propionibacterium cyclohexanicum]
MNVLTRRSRQAGHAPGALVLVGGTSDIGVALLAELLRRRPAPVVLLARAGARRLSVARARLLAAGASEVTTLDMDALDTAGHARVVDEAFARPVDLVVMALGVLGDPEQAWTDQPTAVHTFAVNTTAPVSLGVLVADRLRTQRRESGHGGRIIAISSVAAERVRRANFVYGASKAGMDGFYLGLGDALAPEGLRVLVVRPGFVRSSMTSGRDAALALSPHSLARRIVLADRLGCSLVRVPAVFGPIMLAYRLVPRRLARHLPW